MGAQVSDPYSYEHGCTYLVRPGEEANNSTGRDVTPTDRLSAPCWWQNERLVSLSGQTLRK